MNQKKDAWSFRKPLSSIFDGLIYSRFLAKNNARELKYKEKALEKTKRVLIDVLYFLLKESKIKPKKFKETFIILKLQVSNMFINVWKINPSKDVNIKNIEAKLSYIIRKSSVTSFNINLENEILESFGIPREYEMNDVYSLVATLMAKPFKGKENFLDIYKYSYYLFMFLNLSFYVNENKIHDEPKFFLIKLELIYNMNKLSTKISPIKFNHLNTLVNKNIQKIQFEKLGSETPKGGKK